MWGVPAALFRGVVGCPTILPTPMAERIHLVRHGEVVNPDHLVYASLDGYPLSVTGQAQAVAVAEHLRGRPLVAVWSSPLERALRTAEPVAAAAGRPIKADGDLSEWLLMERWSGAGWDDLPIRFPGELEALVATPAELPFSPESLAQLAARMTRRVQALDRLHQSGEVVVVSHSGPVRAAMLGLVGGPLEDFWVTEPGHGSVTTLTPGLQWRVEDTWAPGEAA